MLSILKNYEELAYTLERCEAVYWGKLYEDTYALKPVKIEIGRAMACTLPGVDILVMNRVIGWGWSGKDPATEINSLIEFYEAHKCPRFFVQLSPLVPEKERLAGLLKESGFRLYNSWSKLWRPVAGYVPNVNTFFEIREIGKDQAEEYGRIIVNSFDWKDSRLISFLASSVGKPGYRHYLLYYENKIVAAGALHLFGQYASMAFAATLPEFRAMGAQSLLIHQRIKDAYGSGARYLIAETAVDSLESPSKSFRNLQKFGFDLAYYRENWVYER